MEVATTIPQDQAAFWALTEQEEQGEYAQKPPDTDPFWDLMEAQEELTKEELCGTASLIFENRIVPLFCGRFRSCAPCKQRRVETWKKRIEAAVKHTGTQWKYKNLAPGDPHPDTKIVFPIKDCGRTILVVLSPDIDGEPLPEDEKLRAALQVWVMTPIGQRPRASHDISCLWHRRKRKNEDGYKPYAFKVLRGSGHIGEIAEQIGAATASLGDGSVEFRALKRLDLVYHLITVKKLEVWWVEKPWDIRNSPMFLLGKNGTIQDGRIQLAESDGPVYGNGPPPMVVKLVL